MSDQELANKTRKRKWMQGPCTILGALAIVFFPPILFLWPLLCGDRSDQTENEDGFESFAYRIGVGVAVIIAVILICIWLPQVSGPPARHHISPADADLEELYRDAPIGQTHGGDPY